MRITNFSLQNDGDCQELSATLGSRRLWYKVRPGHLTEIRADSFVIAGLLPAMASGEDIQVDPSFPVSPKLSTGIGVLQGVYSTFNPALRPVAIRATMAPDAALRSVGGCFFSGGLDGIHTFVRNQDRIGALIFIRGMDFSLENERLFREAFESNSRFAARYGRTLVTVETNIRDFTYPHTRIGLTAFYGPILSSVAHLLSFERTYIAAGLTYSELGPEGDFPLTWPLWSSEACTCICDGTECSRLDKLRFLATYPELLDELRICLANTELNCNRCEKCLINRAMLRALRLTCKSLRHLGALRELAGIRITDVEALTFCQQTEQAAEAAGDKALARVLRRKIFRYLSRQAFWQIDRDLLEGALRRRWRKSREKDWKGSGVPPWERLDFKHADE